LSQHTYFASYAYKVNRYSLYLTFISEAKAAYTARQTHVFANALVVMTQEVGRESTNSMLRLAFEKSYYQYRVHRHTETNSIISAAQTDEYSITVRQISMIFCFQ